MIRNIGNIVIKRDIYTFRQGKCSDFFEPNQSTSAGAVAKEEGFFTLLKTAYSKWRRVYVAILFVGLISLIQGTTLNAEDRTSPRNFYSNDFARNPEGTTRSVNGAMLQNGNQNKNGRISSTNETPSKNKITINASTTAAGEWTVGEVKPPKTNVLPKAMPRGEPITYITALINSSDKKHFSSYLDEFLGVVESRGLIVKAVYGIGKMPDLSDKEVMDQMTRIARAGALFRVIPKVPEEFKATLSPTWLIDTKKGRIILEATGSLNHQINLKGEYLSPDSQVTGHFFKADNVKVK